MISSDVIRGYNDLIILSLLMEGPSYGYHISKRIRDISEDRYIIKETTLYSAFTRLMAQAYVESYSGRSEHGRMRTYYRISELGEKYYHEKCEEWTLTKDVINHFVKE